MKSSQSECSSYLSEIHALSEPKAKQRKMKKAINSKPTCITDREVLLGTGGGKSCKGKRKTGTKKK